MTRRQFGGFRICALTLLASHWYPLDGRRITFAAWHRRSHMCWLWFLDAHWLLRDGKRFGAYHIPGPQSHFALCLWFFGFRFVWQHEGWYRTPEEFRAIRGW